MPGSAKDIGDGLRRGSAGGGAAAGGAAAGGVAAPADQASEIGADADQPFFLLTPSNPPVQEEENTLTFGDLQGNLVWFIDALLSGPDPILEITGANAAEKDRVKQGIKECIAASTPKESEPKESKPDVPAEEDAAFVAAVDQAFSEAEAAAAVDANLTKFIFLLQHCTRVNRHKQVRLIGDVLCDRVGHDGFMLGALHVLREKGLRIRELFSNHFHKIGPYLLTGGKAEFKPDKGQYLSGWRLKRDIDEGRIKWERIAPWVKSYMKHIVLVDVVKIASAVPTASTSASTTSASAIEGDAGQSPQFRMYSHAPIGYTTLIALCMKLKVEPDLRPDHILTTIEALNKVFQVRIHHGSLGDPSVDSFVDVSYSEIDVDPFAGMTYQEVSKVLNCGNNADLEHPELRAAYFRADLPTVVPNEEGAYRFNPVQEYFGEVDALNQQMTLVQKELQTLECVCKKHPSTYKDVGSSIVALGEQLESLEAISRQHVVRTSNEQGMAVKIPENPTVPVISQFVHGHEGATIPPAMSKEFSDQIREIFGKLEDDELMENGIVALKHWCEAKGCDSTENLFETVKARVRQDRRFDDSLWKDPVMDQIIAEMSLYVAPGVSPQQHVPEGVDVTNLDHGARRVREYRGEKGEPKAGLVCITPEASFPLEKTHIQVILRGVLVLEQLKHLKPLLSKHRDLEERCHQAVKTGQFAYDADTVSNHVGLKTQILKLLPQKEIISSPWANHYTWKNETERYVEENYEALSGKSIHEICSAYLAEVETWGVYMEFERFCEAKDNIEEALGGPPGSGLPRP